jgi:Tfp pilus assembly protein PilO
MNWMVTIVLAGVLVLFVAVGYAWGSMDQKLQQRSREEAIRKQAYEDGRKSVRAEQLEYISMIPPELSRYVHTGIWTSSNRDTKESS